MVIRNPLSSVMVNITKYLLKLLCLTLLINFILSMLAEIILKILAPLANASCKKITRLKNPDYLPQKYHDLIADNYVKNMVVGRPVSFLFYAFNSVESYFILS